MIKDVTSELMSLLEIYEETKEVCQEYEDEELDELNFLMKSYLEAKAETQSITAKIDILREKLGYYGDIGCCNKEGCNNKDDE